MCGHEELTQRGIELFQELARTTDLSDSVLRFTVDGGWLAKIEAVGGSRICRPAKQDAVWSRPTSTSDPQLQKVAQHTSPELEDVITRLTGNYGFVEVEFGRGKMISLIMKMALCCAPRPALCR